MANNLNIFLFVLIEKIMGNISNANIILATDYV